MTTHHSRATSTKTSVVLPAVPMPSSISSGNAMEQTSAIRSRCLRGAARKQHVITPCYVCLQSVCKIECLNSHAHDEQGRNKSEAPSKQGVD